MVLINHVLHKVNMISFHSIYKFVNMITILSHSIAKMIWMCLESMLVLPRRDLGADLTWVWMMPRRSWLGNPSTDLQITRSDSVVWQYVFNRSMQADWGHALVWPELERVSAEFREPVAGTRTQGARTRHDCFHPYRGGQHTILTAFLWLAQVSMWNQSIFPDRHSLPLDLRKTELGWP